MNKNLLYLLTILEAIEKIKLYTAFFTDADMLYEAESQKPFNACLNLLIVIGEESKKIDPQLRQRVTLNWDAIIGLRNHLSHNYRGTDPDIVWDIILHYLAPLKEGAISLVWSLHCPTDLQEILSTKYYKNIQYLTALDKDSQKP